MASLKVDIKNTETFEKLLESIKSILEDERIDKSIRKEYQEKIAQTIKS